MGRMLALTVMFACFGCKPPPPAPADAAPPVVAEPLPALPTSVPDGGPPDVAAPAAADDETSILKSLCDAVLVDGRVACDAHPPFQKKRAAGAPVPAVTVDDPAKVCHPDGVFVGAFTRPGVTEAVISFDACYDAGDGYQTSYAQAMSTVLAEKVNGAWQEKAYLASQSAAGCSKAHRADGRDVLVCASGFGAFSAGAVTWLSVYDFAQKQESGTVAWMFESDVDCNYMQIVDPELARGSVRLKVGERTVADLNGDGSQDVTFTIERSHDAVAAATLAKFKKGCEANPPVQPKVATSKPLTYRIEVVSKGNSYALSPASKAIVDQWTRETGDDMGGIRGAAPKPIWAP